MVMPNWMVGTGAAFLVATTTILPSDTAFQVSDFYGTVTRDSSKIRLTRLIVDGQGFEHCAPGARIRFAVTVDALSQVGIKLNYTGLVTRTDTYNDVGSIYVNGALETDFTGPAVHTPGQPHPTGLVIPSLFVAAGTHLIEVVLPYCAAVDFGGAVVPETAAVSAPTARVSRRDFLFGDSITHGFNASKIRTHWPFLTALENDAQQINYGYGGRELNAGDFTNAGNAGADNVHYLIGFNNFYPGGANLTTFKNTYKTGLTNFRSATTAAGKPNARFFARTPFDAPSAYGGGTYAGNSPSLEQFRQAIRDAVSEVGDPYVELVEGLASGMPTGSSRFLDGIHPNDLASSEVSPIVASDMA